MLLTNISRFNLMWHHVFKTMIMLLGCAHKYTHGFTIQAECAAQTTDQKRCERREIERFVW